MAICSIAIAAGVIGVVGIVKALLFRRRVGGHGCSGGRGGFGGFGGRRGGIGRSFWLRALYSRLDTTPGQEREIRSAIEELRERARDAKQRERLAEIVGQGGFGRWGRGGGGWAGPYRSGADL